MGGEWIRATLEKECSPVVAVSKEGRSVYPTPLVVFDSLLRPYIWRLDNPELLFSDNPFSYEKIGSLLCDCNGCAVAVAIRIAVTGGVIGIAGGCQVGYGIGSGGNSILQGD